jgi:hypothetical protein
VPIFTISIRKQLTSNSMFAWSNVYHVEATDILSAKPYAASLVAVERGMHSPAVTFNSYRISDENGPLAPVIVPLATAGTAGVGGDLLPVFLAVRVDFLALQGRPGRKYYHILAGEGQQANGIWDPTLVSNFQTAFNGIATDFSAWLTNPTGAYFYTAAAVFAPVTQHQFKRKWARRGVPA